MLDTFYLTKHSFNSILNKFYAFIKKLKDVKNQNPSNYYLVSSDYLNQNSYHHEVYRYMTCIELINTTFISIKRKMKFLKTENRI